jgi:hypothetical protein
MKIIDFAIRILTFFVTLVATIVGGCWVWLQYEESGATDWQNNITLKTEVLSYHDDLRLLVVHVKSKNPRSYKFELDSRQHDSFKLHVRQLVSDAAAGRVFNKNEGDLIAKVNLLEQADGNYVFLPQAEMDDMQAVVVKANTWVSITVDMNIHNGMIDAHGQPDSDFNTASDIIYIPK